MAEGVGVIAYEDPLATLHQGDCRAVLASLPAESVQCCICSPPYWGLRDYKIPPLVWGGQAGCDHVENLVPSQFCAKCGAWLGSLGLEPSPEMYVQHIVEVFRAVRRVLRKDGTVWLNMGDSYASQGGPLAKGGGINDILGGKQETQDYKVSRRAPISLKPLDLIGLPWRVAFALQADGWWLRADCIWAKPNPMPESVSGSRWERHRVKIAPVSSDTYSSQKNRQGEGIGTGWSPAHPEYGEKPTIAVWEDCPGCTVCAPNDGLVLRRGSWRPTTSHEYVFMLAKSAEYFADGEAVREAQDPRAIENNKYKNQRNWHHSLTQRSLGGQETGLAAFQLSYYPTNGRNKRSVWEITTQPYAGAHFATFPEKLVEPCLLAGTSERGACPRCGRPWVRVIENKPMVIRRTNWGDLAGNRTASSGTMVEPNETETLGFRPACACGEAEARPCVVLDPFAGSGTVGVVARQWGRKAILIELSEKYCELAVKRLTETQPALKGGDKNENLRNPPDREGCIA